MVVSVTLWAGQAASAAQLPAVMIAAFVLVLFPLTESLLPVGDALGHVPDYRESLERLNRLEGQEGTGTDTVGKKIEIIETSIQTKIETRIEARIVAAITSSIRSGSKILGNPV